MGGGGRIVDAIGIVDDGDPGRNRFPHERPYAVGADGGNHDGIIFIGNAIVELVELRGEILIPAGFEQLHAEMIALRLLHHAVVTRDPV